MLFFGGKKKKGGGSLALCSYFKKILRLYFIIADINVVESMVTKQHLAYSVYLFPLYISIDLDLKLL